LYAIFLLLDPELSYLFSITFGDPDGDLDRPSLLLPSSSHAPGNLGTQQENLEVLRSRLLAKVTLQFTFKSELNVSNHVTSRVERRKFNLVFHLPMNCHPRLLQNTSTFSPPSPTKLPTKLRNTFNAFVMASTTRTLDSEVSGSEQERDPLDGGFVLFLKLPIELRLIVWKMALPGTSIPQKKILLRVESVNTILPLQLFHYTPAAPSSPINSFKE
jgi:hypothetical protein